MAEIHFEWNESNTDHIARHGVTPVEAEEVIAGGPIVLLVQSGTGSDACCVRGELLRAARSRWSIPFAKAGFAWLRRSPPSEA